MGRSEELDRNATPRSLDASQRHALGIGLLSEYQLAGHPEALIYALVAMGVCSPADQRGLQPLDQPTPLRELVRRQQAQRFAPEHEREVGGAAVSAAASLDAHSAPQTRRPRRRRVYIDD